jgi:hypothetical protein
MRTRKSSLLVVWRRACPPHCEKARGSIPRQRNKMRIMDIHWSLEVNSPRWSVHFGNAMEHPSRMKFPRQLPVGRRCLFPRQRVSHGSGGESNSGRELLVMAALRRARLNDGTHNR